MKIAILTSGILPVPAVKGGAVENLIDFYLAYNEQYHLHDITIYSVADKGTIGHPALQSTVNHYYYIEVNSVTAKIRKFIFHHLHRQKEYYHYTIEYFLHEAIKHIRHQHYDLILMENRPGYALQIKSISNAKIVFHLHNDILNKHTKKYTDIYDAATGIITVSNYISNCVKTINPKDNKCTTVYNGIDLKAFSPIKGASNSSKIFTLIFWGRLIPEKGVLPLIQAIKKLKGNNIKLIILGGSSLGNDKTSSPYLQQIQEVSEGLNNIIYTGYVDYSSIGAYLKESDLAVLPSLWDEPFGLTCIEALAAGLPIITTNRGGIPEILNETCAVLFNTDEQLSNNIASSILDLYHHPQKRIAMSQAALAHSEYFSKERYARDFFNAIELSQMH